jgi:hypothetical protein
MGAIGGVNTMHVRGGEARGSGSLTLVVQVNYFETSNPATPAGDRNVETTEFDAFYEVKVSESLGRSGRRRWTQSTGRRHVGLWG